MSERDDRPVLPETTSDESDEGWGERPDEETDDTQRFLEERPPHHRA